MRRRPLIIHTQYNCKRCNIYIHITQPCRPSPNASHPPISKTIYLPPLRLTQSHQPIIILPADPPSHESRLQQLRTLLEHLLRRSTDIADVAHVAAHGVALAYKVRDDLVVAGAVEVDECWVRVGGGGGGRGGGGRRGGLCRRLWRRRGAGAVG